MSKFPSPPRTRLPWEVILLVLEEADPPTLAVLGRVSYNFLDASSPLLYGSVTVHSVKALKELFCGREETETSTSSRINSLLSLSRIRTLALDYGYPSSWNPRPPLSLSFSRMDKSDDTLPLKHLMVTVHPSWVSIYPLLHSALFPQLNPTRFTFTCSPWTQDAALVTVRLDRPAPALSAWTRIQELSFVGRIVYVVPESGPLLLGGLLTPSLDRPRIVRIRVEIDRVILVLDVLGRGSRNFGFEGMQEGTVIFVAKSKEEKVEIEGLVRASQDIERRRRVFAVEVGI